MIKTEEKGSDVTLGALLVAHGYQKRYEAAIVLSNDSDLVLPIKIVREELAWGSETVSAFADPVAG